MPDPVVTRMDVRVECEDMADAIARAAAEGADVRGLEKRWRARAVALDGAPAGAGREWLAARGDEGAQAAIAVDCEVQR